MKSRLELESVKSFIERSYSRLGNKLSVKITSSENFNPNLPLGYCYRYVGESGSRVYRVVCSEIGIERTDFRILMHEYGHIYLGHLDGIHETLDTQICNVIRDHRDELIERVNQECGIDFGEKLIERIIDDPSLNHSLHNIAMDMEVNSKILSLEDIEEMEKDITSVYPKYEEEYLKYVSEHTNDENLKKQIQDTLKKMENETKVKLIVPERYEFPNDLSYPEYIILIIKNMDKFVKMMVSIQKGGNGDTSGITSDDVKSALSGGSGDGQGDGGEGSDGQQQDSSSGSGSGSNGMKGLDELMDQMGMSPKNGNSGKFKSKDEEAISSKYKGTRNGNNGNESGDGDQKKDQESLDQKYGGDHRTESRDAADKKRELGQIVAGGGVGCGDTGGPDATRLVDVEVDEVDMALTEVIKKFKKKVVKKKLSKDMTFLYNRGINRSVIAPIYRRKAKIVKDPTITFLIDISGSMDTRLVDRCLKTISKCIKRINRGLRYNIITWSTRLGEHIKNINPTKGVPRISCGGGTSIASGIKYFKENYTEDSILVIISDFEDYLQEWHEVEKTMSGYTMYGFNYGSSNYKQEFKNLQVRNFSNYGY